MTEQPKITFRISKPNRVIETKRVDKVLLPAENGNILVLPRRAPTLVLIRRGAVKVLNSSNEVTDVYYVSNGVADIARDRCAVSAEHVLHFDEINAERAEYLHNKATNDEDRAYYEMILSEKKLG